MTGSVPDKHIASAQTFNIIPQVTVGSKNNLFVLGQAIYDLQGIARSYHQVAQSFYSRRSIDIADNRMIGMSLDKSFKFAGRTTLGQRTTRSGIGNQDFFVW